MKNLLTFCSLFCYTNDCKVKFANYGLLAQLVEQQTLNLWVRGSSPRQSTT